MEITPSWIQHYGFLDFFKTSENLRKLIKELFDFIVYFHMLMCYQTNKETLKWKDQIT